MARIVTAGDAKFKEMIPYSVAKAEALGYEVDVYDLGGLGMGIPLPTPQADTAEDRGYDPCLFKLEAIERSLKKGAPIVWIDGDCVLQERVDELFNESYDVGLAYRTYLERLVLESARRAGAINTGVMTFYPTPAVFNFLPMWREKAIEMNHEQGAMNELIKATGCLIFPRIFPCGIYNNYYFDSYFGETQEGAKILHYKSQFRGRHPALCA